MGLKIENFTDDSLSAEKSFEIQWFRNRTAILPLRPNKTKGLGPIPAAAKTFGAPTTSTT
jgi:hypothetical protein